MLDQEIIEALAQDGDFSAATLYDVEVAQLPRLSRQEQRDLVDRARQGQKEARHLLVLNCLHWALMKAHCIYNERRPLHIDVLDLMAEANLQMLERVDKALSADDPVAYLMTIAVRAMRVYCTYYAPLIRRPELSLERLAKTQPAPFLMESLDAPVSEDGKEAYYEQIAAPDLHLVEEQQQDQQVHDCFAQLYDALQRLSSSRRTALIRLYGLFGQPAETPADIARTSQITPASVRTYASDARHRLSLLLLDDQRSRC